MYLYNLDQTKFPMVNAFNALAQSVDTGGCQSAPTCMCDWTEDHWQRIESILANLPANDFVTLAWQATEEDMVQATSLIKNKYPQLDEFNDGWA